MKTLIVINNLGCGGAQKSLVTYLNGMQIGDIGSYLNVFSCCVVYVYCLERNPQRIIGYTSIVFTLLLLFNTILWKDGGQKHVDEVVNAICEKGYKA